MSADPFTGTLRGRRVLVTGHTGFKGAWLSHWLDALGARVCGMALAPTTQPNLFTLLGLAERVAHHVVDIRDGGAVAAVTRSFAPEVVLHLAAQPLVRDSYADPKATFDINVGGTVNVLEAVRGCASVRACVVVTSDKCYDNREWPWGYRESDALGGHDPYSASKGAAEIVTGSYRRSFFADGRSCRLASARAGNVIGGGDWSKDRIVCDFVAAIRAGQALRLRNPHATRPWQHVIEPLSGYLHLAARLLGDDGTRYAEAWNFGPREDAQASVRTLAEALANAWGPVAGRAIDVVDASTPGQPHEAGMLKLDCSKARAALGWHGLWDLATTAQRTAAWYRSATDAATARVLCDADLAAYVADARRLGVAWSRAAT